MFGETFVKEGEECVYFFVLSILDVKKGFASSSCNHHASRRGSFQNVKSHLKIDMLEKRSLVRPCLRSHNQSATVEVLLQSTMNCRPGPSHCRELALLKASQGVGKVECGFPLVCSVWWRRYFARPSVRLCGP